MRFKSIRMNDKQQATFTSVITLNERMVKHKLWDQIAGSLIKCSLRKYASLNASFEPSELSSLVRTLIYLFSKEKEKSSFHLKLTTILQMYSNSCNEIRPRCLFFGWNTGFQQNYKCLSVMRCLIGFINIIQIFHNFWQRLSWVCLYRPLHAH